MAANLPNDTAAGSFVIDFTQVAGIEPLPDGWYNVSIAEVKPGVSKQGHPKMDLQLIVEDGEYAGRRIFDTLSFHPQALWRTKAVMVAFGYAEDFSGAIEPGDMVGRVAEIRIAIEQGAIDPSTNEPYPARNRVKQARASGSGNALGNLLK
jgi:hypothetical protein